VDIVELSLLTHDLAAQHAFYTRILGVPLVEGTPTSFAVQAGATRLVFAETARPAPPYHLAFNIPRTALPAAKHWLTSRAPLLARDGRDEFAFASWDARSVYFRDPAGNIVEFIARQASPPDAGDASGAFGPHDLRCVSEIGLPVDDTSARAADLSARLGLAPYKEQSDAFAPLGDEHGLFIVVRVGRPWLPTDDVYAAATPVRVVIRGAREQVYHMPGLPYDIEMTMTSR